MRASYCRQAGAAQPPADLAAVVDVILQVAQLALDHPQIQEIDINPLMVYPAGAEPGALAVDVRMVLGLSSQ